jgi:FkbM family methyltransferase
MGKRVLLAAVFVLAFLGALLQWPRIRHVLFHRAPECSVGASFRDRVRERLRLATARSVPRHLVRTEGDVQLWALPDGQFWAPRDGTASVVVMATPTRYGHFGDEPVIRPGDVYLDCGGFIGDTAKEALHMGASKVVSFEPSPANLKCLRRNLASEIQSGRLIVYPKGVWEREETLHFQTEPTNAQADKVEDKGTVAIPVTTIDKAVEELGLQRLDVIKMDIEGAEQKALMGAQATIKRFKPRLIMGSYHVEDDYKKLPVLVKQIRSDYAVRCGRCLSSWHGEIIPHVFYFN